MLVVDQKTKSLKMKKGFLRAALLAAAITNASNLTLRADHAPRAVLPDAVVDLRSTEGIARVQAQWRYSDTMIREIEHRDVGADLKASGPKNHTFDFTPDARASDADELQVALDTRQVFVFSAHRFQDRGVPMSALNDRKHHTTQLITPK